jgi:hypothetical protein
MKSEMKSSEPAHIGHMAAIYLLSSALIQATTCTWLTAVDVPLQLAMQPSHAARYQLTQMHAIPSHPWTLPAPSLDLL